MEIKHLDYIYCHDGCTQPLSIAKVRNKYVFIYAPIEGQGVLGEYKVLSSYKYDEMKPFLQMHGYSLVFVRKGTSWYLWKYYLREYESNKISLNVHIFYDCILQEINGISDVSIKELYKRCKGDIPEQFWSYFDGCILDNSSIS